MDSSTIQTIADNLGIAVSSTDQFLKEVLPSYANAQILANVGWFIFTGILITASIIGIIIIVLSIRKERKRYEEHNRRYDCDDCIGRIIIFAGLVIVIVFALMVFVSSIITMIQWATCPEGRFVMDILQVSNN